MGGKSKKVTVGYWYKLLFHMGLGIGPIDAFLEFRGGDQTAWSGELTASGTISINAPNLWGGEKDQGGIVGDVDVMFGETTQAPNAYLLANLGDQVPASRGLATIVFKGGRYGAMNPYPQKAAFKFRKILQGWDDPGCWYPEKAQVNVSASASIAGSTLWRYLIVPYNDSTDYSAPGLDDSGWAQGARPVAGNPNQLDLSAEAESHGFSGSPAISIPINHSIWMRGSILVAGQPTSLRFQCFVDNNAFLYVNGSLAAQAIMDPHHGYADVPINTSLFHQGANAIAVHGVETASGATNTFWLDWRIVDPGGIPAMNPAHILYYARTQQHMGREPTARMADANWKTAADWYYSQSFGLCTSWDPSQESVDDFNARICAVAGCAVNRSPVDGLWYIDIANGVYDLASLPILSDDDILEFSAQPSLPDVAVNSVTVTYTDPQQKQDCTAPPVQALGLVDTFGTINQSTDYKEIPTAALATRIAGRDLLASVTPKHAFDLTTTRKPYSWRRNSYFRLQAPKRGISDMVCIVGDVSGGTLKSGAITLSVLEDVYSLPATSYVTAESGVDTRPSPIPIAVVAQHAFEAPYIDLVRALAAADLDALPIDAGYLMAVAADPATTRDYTLTVSTDGGGTYGGDTYGEWCPSAMIVEGDVLTDAAPATAFTLVGGALFDRVAIGSAALWDAEIVRVDALDAVAGTLTLGRGCADTVPAPHAANSRIWFFDDAAATDGVQYAAAEHIDVKLLTNTGSQQLDPGLATPVALTFAGRAALPYPPAAMKIADAWYPSTASGTVTIAWAERNRVQQADQLVDTTAGTLTPARNTRYHLRLADETDATLAERDDLAGTSASFVLDYTGAVTLTLSTIDDGGESLQAQRCAFAYTPPSGTVVSAITGTAYTPDVPTWNLDGNLGT